MHGKKRTIIPLGLFCNPLGIKNRKDVCRGMRGRNNKGGWVGSRMIGIMRKNGIDPIANRRNPIAFK